MRRYCINTQTEPGSAYKSRMLYNNTAKASLLKKAIRLIVFGLWLFVPFADILKSAETMNNSAASQAVSEYEVKAAYLYYFAKFVDWPPDALRTQNAPIIIGIVGDDEFGVTIESIVRGKTIQEHPIMIRLLKWSSDLSACHIVFIGSSEQKRINQIVELLKSRPVLTVTETEDASQTRGIVNFFVQVDRIQFEVDVNGAERAHLKISSKLIRLGKSFMENRTGKAN